MFAQFDAYNFVAFKLLCNFFEKYKKSTNFIVIIISVVGNEKIYYAGSLSFFRKLNLHGNVRVHGFGCLHFMKMEEAH